METILNESWHSNQLTDSKRGSKHNAGERFTFFNLLRAFINESITASEITLGHLSPCSLPTQIKFSWDSGTVKAYWLKVNSIGRTFLITASLDICGEIETVFTIHNNDAAFTEIEPSIDLACWIIGIPESQKHLLHANSKIAILMANKLQEYKTILSDQKSPCNLWSMQQSDRYIYLEQKYNVERPKLNPISHAFIGDIRHHPFLMSSSQIKIHLYKSNFQLLNCNVLENGGKNANAPLKFFKNDIDNTLFIPIHPYSIDYFKSIYPEFEQDLIPVGTLDCSPTTSIRTLFYEDQKTSFQIKCSYTGQITSHSRILNMEEAINGLRTTHVFMQLYNRKLLPRNVYFMPELAMIHHKRQPLITSLIRGGFESIYPRLTQSQTIIPSFALCSPTPNNAPRIIDQLITNSGLSAETYFTELANYLITGYLNLLKLGLGHESHAQNTLIVCDLSNFRVQGICLRDLESTKIHKAILHRHGIIPEHHNTDNARQTRSMAVLPDNDPEVYSYFLTTGYTHGIIDSQLGYIALYLASKYQVNILKLAQSAKNIYISWWRKEKFSFTEYCHFMSSEYLRRNLLAKGLSLQTTPVPYRKIEKSPFFPDYMEMEKKLT